MQPGVYVVPVLIIAAGLLPGPAGGRKSTGQHLTGKVRRISAADSVRSEPPVTRSRSRLIGHNVCSPVAEGRPHSGR
jgi:hypothetical protein